MTLAGWHAALDDLRQRANDNGIEFSVTLFDWDERTASLFLIEFCYGGRWAYLTGSQWSQCVVITAGRRPTPARAPMHTISLVDKTGGDTYRARAMHDVLAEAVSNLVLWDLVPW